MCYVCREKSRTKNRIIPSEEPLQSVIRMWTYIYVEMQYSKKERDNVNLAHDFLRSAYLRLNVDTTIGQILICYAEKMRTFAEELLMRKKIPIFPAAVFFYMYVLSGFYIDILNKFNKNNARALYMWAGPPRMKKSLFLC